jgi:hypothetical protein
MRLQLRSSGIRRNLDLCAISTQAFLTELVSRPFTAVAFTTLTSRFSEQRRGRQHLSPDLGKSFRNRGNKSHKAPSFIKTSVEADERMC